MSDRFGLSGSVSRMKAVVTTGHGGFDKLDYRDVPVPVPGTGEVLLLVLAAGMNNTEINTRLGWYSGSVTGGTTDTALSAERSGSGALVKEDDGGWDTATPFPFIQGTDCCGRVVAVGQGVDAARIGERVLVRPCMRSAGFDSLHTVWMGSDFDGAFAQYVKVPAREVFAVRSGWSDAELASMPCSWGTAENMLQRAQVVRGQHVLVAGASGGVGSAAVQLAKLRGARVTALAAKAKMKQVLALGADAVLERDADVVAALGQESVDVVVDNVAGPGFGRMLQTLRRGGRYVSSGAIGGPVVALDMRTFYLRDLLLIGCTAWDEPVFPDLVAIIERDAVRPLVARSFALEQIALAQRLFLEKAHVGNFVLIPPPVAAQDTPP